MIEDNPLPPILEPEVLPAPAPESNRGWAGITSLILGIINLFIWCLPVCGGPLAAFGILFGVLGLKTNNRGLSIAGIVLNIIGLILSIIAVLVIVALWNSGWFQNFDPGMW